MIKDHGNWVRYTPSSIPVPHNVMYAKRDGAGFGQDWYEYVASKPFAANAVVMTVMHTETGSVVQAATFDPTEIFPANFGVIEETEYLGDDPFGDFHGLTYSGDARKVGPGKYMPPPPPPTPTERNIMQALDAILARLDKLEEK